MDKIIKEYTHEGVSLFMFPVSNQVNGEIINPKLSADFLQAAYDGERWGEIRVLRDQLISETDWTQASDAPLTAEKKSEFTAYRQALRDIPQIYSDPDAVVWPEKPTV